MKKRRVLVDDTAQLEEMTVHHDNVIENLHTSILGFIYCNEPRNTIASICRRQVNGLFPSGSMIKVVMIPRIAGRNLLRTNIEKR